MEDKLLNGAVVFCCIIVVALFGWLIYDMITSDKLVLTAREWRCTKSHNELLIMQQVGKVLIPQYHTVCTTYERNQ